VIQNRIAKINQGVTTGEVGKNIMAQNQRGGSSEQHAKAGSQSKGGQGKSSSGSSQGGGSRTEAARKGGESHSKEHMSEIGKKGGRK